MYPLVPDTKVPTVVCRWNGANKCRKKFKLHPRYKTEEARWQYVRRHEGPPEENGANCKAWVAAKKAKKARENAKRQRGKKKG